MVVVQSESTQHLKDLHLIAKDLDIRPKFTNFSERAILVVKLQRSALDSCNLTNYFPLFQRKKLVVVKDKSMQRLKDLH